MKRVLLLVVIAACKKDASPPGPGPGSGSAATIDCAGVIGPAIDRAAREGVANGAGTDGELPAGEIKKMQDDTIASLGPVKDATIKACVDDKWPADVLTCIKDKGAITECDAKLTPAMRQHREELANAAAKAQTANAPAYCTKYANFEIQCSGAEEGARPTILDFCTRAPGNPDPTYKLIALESKCAETSTDCTSYKACVDEKKRTEHP
ncbi:MAG: hypothetical protein QM831_42760 [Kofleriaceae bacterium]